MSSYRIQNRTQVKLRRSGNDLYTIQWVPEHGNHHYKYLVDDDWQVAPNQPTEECDGVVNNVINLDHFVTLEEEEKNQIREEKERTERLFNEVQDSPSKIIELHSIMNLPPLTHLRETHPFSLPI